MAEVAKAITPEMSAKINSFRAVIYGLLGNQRMTHDELVGCIMSEPYNIGPEDLYLATIALNNLSEADLLLVTFRTNKQKLTIEPVFRASLRKKRP